MLETHAIFVDGIPGSGKTTLSKWLTDRLLGIGKPTTLFLEMCDNHPLRVYEPIYTDFTEPSQVKAYKDRYIERYTNFVQRTKDSDDITVFDSRLFQGTISLTYFLRMHVDEAIDFAFTLLEILSPLHPVLIYVAQDDVEANWRRICAERDKAWTEGHCGITDDDHFVHAGVAWSTIQAFCLAIIRKWRINKLVITNTDYNWEHHKAKIAEFLRIEAPNSKEYAGGNMSFPRHVITSQ